MRQSGLRQIFMAVAAAMLVMLFPCTGGAAEEGEVGSSVTKNQEDNEDNVQEFGGREFNSELYLTVVAKRLKDGERVTEMVGMTPGQVALWVPKCYWWAISPLDSADEVDWQALIRVIKQKNVPGLTLPPDTTDDDLHHLESIEKIQILNLNSTKVTDNGLAQLKDLNNLRTLVLRHTGITDKGLQHLKKLEKLRRLDLSFTKVKGHELHRLQGLNHLRELHLSSLDVSDADVKDLTELKELRYLDLSVTQITDKALEVVERFPNIQLLNVQQTAVTDKEVERLRNAVEDLKVFH